MSPSRESEREIRGEEEPERKEPESAGEELPRGDPPPSEAGAPQTLGLLFFAALAGLVALLVVVGLIAYAAMSR